MLALGEMPIDRAIIDGGITPYQLPHLVRKLLLWRDIVSFKMAANSRKILEAAFPPERFTPTGHDPKKEYDAMEAYLKTFSDRRFAIYSGLPTTMRFKTPCKDRHEDHLLVRRRRKERPQAGYPIHQALFFSDAHPRHSENGPCGAGDGTPGKILPVCGKISDYASGGKMI